MTGWIAAPVPRANVRKTATTCVLAAACGTANTPFVSPIAYSRGELTADRPDSSGFAVAITAAAQALQSAWSHPVRLRLGDVIRTWGRHTLLRCEILDGPSSAPRTVVVKQANVRDGAIRNEWASLEYLGALSNVRAPVPTLLAGDPVEELLVLEDIGDAPTLHQLLRSKREWAREALLDSMRSLANVHGSTRERSGDHRAMRANLSAAGDGKTEIDATLASLSESLEHAVGGLDIAVPSRELEQITQALTASSLECFTFDDQCPPNRIVAAGGMRFIDLERGAFRHPFIDGAYPRIGHLRCMDGLRLPDEVQLEMLAVYREELAAFFPDLAESERFEREMTYACGLWLVRLLSALPAALTKDRTVGFFAITSRQRIIASLDAFLAISAAAEHVPALVATSRRILEELGQRWPDVKSLPRFPAFDEDVVVSASSLDDREVQQLIATLNAELSDTYPEPGATHFDLDAEEVEEDRGAILVARKGSEPIGCGAVRLIDESSAEIKRMFTTRSARGLGVGRALLNALEETAKALGAKRLVLETGTRQRRAIALYEGAGYSRIEPFGDYADSPLSICFEKRIANS